MNEEVSKNTNEKQSELNIVDKVEISKILLAFEIYDGIYKRHYVDAALELKEEITLFDKGIRKSSCRSLHLC